MTPSIVSPSGVEPSRRRRSRWPVAAIAWFAASTATAGSALAQYDSPPGVQQNIEGLTVIGKGTVSAAPDLAEIELDVSASAEITGDAIVKFRDAKKRILDAFEALKLPNVAVEERGLLVDQKGAGANPYYVDYGVPQSAKAEVQLSRKLVVKATGLRAMDEDATLQLVGRLLDVAQDAGARVGPAAPNDPYGILYQLQRRGAGADLVRFVLEDAGELQDQAYAKAVADARERAERLARLGGLELGPIVAVREVTATATPNRVVIGGIDLSGGGEDEPAGHRLASSKLGKIPIRVDLQVRFEIRPSVNANAKAPAQ